MSPVGAHQGDSASKAVTVLAATALLLVLALSGLTAYLVTKSDDNARTASRLSSLIQESRYYDEVLTMSARYAAASGDLAYVTRYERAAQEFDALLAETEQLLRSSDGTTELAPIVEANQPLLAAEATALSDVRQGRTDDALAVLSGPAYVRDKMRFDAAFQQALESLGRDRDRSLDRTQGLRTAALVAAGLGAAVIVSAGVVARRAARRWYLEREAARAERDAAGLRSALVLDAAGEGIYGLDSDGRVTFVNPAALALTGHTQSELVGKHSHAVVHHSRPDGSPMPLEECQVRRAQQSLVPARGVSDVYWRADGTPFPIEMTVTPVGEGDGAVVVFRDVSDRRAVERMKDEFISVVSHELRTPLTSIRGSLGLLTSGAMGELTPRAARMLEIAESNTDRLVRLINDILDIERIESGEIRLELARVSAQRLVGQAVDGIRGMADAAGVRVEATGEDVPVRVDADRILQTLTNLLSNAVKFSTRDGLVEVSVHHRDGHAVFAVQDQGRGIPSDKLETIFGRFQQVDASDARQKGGSGLGLAISRSIVEQHGGRIWVESEPGRGSTFRFSVPAQQAVSTPPVHGGGRRILVVDDDPAVLEAVAAMLTEQGYSAATAASGREALRVAAHSPPDAILLDLVMPGTSGWDVLATLRGRPETARVPIVILSVLRESQQNARDGGYSAWLSKPVDQGELLSAVERAVIRGQQRREAADARRVLLVEDDHDLSSVLAAMLERHGLQVEPARDAASARVLVPQLQPDLVIADVQLGEGPDGTLLLEQLHDDGQLVGVPTVVYTAHELDDVQRARLAGMPVLVLTKSRVPPEAFEQRILQLLGMNGEAVHPPAADSPAS